jgi:hypothetical protein
MLVGKHNCTYLKTYKVSNATQTLSCLFNHWNIIKGDGMNHFEFGIFPLANGKDITYTIIPNENLDIIVKSVKLSEMYNFLNKVNNMAIKVIDDLYPPKSIYINTFTYEEFIINLYLNQSNKSISLITDRHYLGKNIYVNKNNHTLSELNDFIFHMQKMLIDMLIKHIPYIAKNINKNIEPILNICPNNCKNINEFMNAIDEEINELFYIKDDVIHKTINRAVLEYFR